MTIPLQSSFFAPFEMSHCLSAAFHEREGANLRKSVLINNATLTAMTLDSSAREASASCRAEKQGPLLPQNDEASFFDELLDELSDRSSGTLPRYTDTQSSVECQDDQSEHTLLVSMADTDTALNPHKVVAFSSSAPSPSCACDEIHCSETAQNDCKSDSCDDLPSLVADSQESIDDDCWEDVLNDVNEARPCHALGTVSNQTRKAPFHNLTRDYDQLSAAESSP